MGTYLSTPVTEKHLEEGQSRGGTLQWGVVDMQGWRKTMEDAHIAQTNIPIQAAQESGETTTYNAHIFGVFDGHGGPEVARFTALYLVSVLQQQLRKQTSLEGGLGRALVEAFHALDRMIDDASRRDELVRLRVASPLVAEQRKATNVPPKYDPVLVPTAPPVEATPEVPQATLALDLCTDTDTTITGTSQLDDSAVTVDTGVSPETAESHADGTQDYTVATRDGVDEASSSLETANEKETSKLEEGMEVVDGSEPTTNSANAPAINSSALMTNPSSAFVAPQSVDSEAVAPITNSNSSSAAGKVSGMLQRLLKLGTPSGGVALQVGKHGMITTRVLTPNVPTASKPTIVRNGQMMCNLPDHPIHAGATAIVAVLCDNTLVVANAGDSRAVLCRGGGVTVPLSFDHKPMEVTELSRIRAAGGFVNAFGRVNGNLNLSRSIGDLKYKQVPGIPPALQMITAEPDVLELTLCDDDEFIILGCDGIWDCLTNEKAVEFVRSRLHEKSPTEIGVEMLKTIISDDPRATQGIGGDNMTIMIVDLQPNQRNYRERVGSSRFQPTTTK